MVHGRRMLGLAVAKHSATAVELAGGKGGAQVRRAAELAFPAEVGVDAPDQLGKALKAFLRQERFTATRCVIGIDAARLVARERSLPPGSEDVVTDTLALAVEREFASDRRELVFDYATGSGPNGNPAALLVAAPRRHLDHLVAAAQAAGLTVAGVTSSTMALAESANGLMLADRLVLHVFRGGTEVAVRSDTGLIRVWRLPVSPPTEDAGDAAASGPWLDTLARELLQAVQVRLGEAGLGQMRELLVWNEAGPDPQAWLALAERLGVPIRLCASDEARGPADGDRAPRGGQYSAAAAMALAGLKRQPLSVDFLHSRLAPRKESAIGKKMVWGIGVAAAILVAGGLLVFGLLQDERTITDLENRLAANATNIRDARDVVDKATFARRWYDRRPRVLDCMHELTRIFPAEGGIWATSLRMNEGMRGVVAGKATSEAMVLEVLDRLKANPQFADVTPTYLRDAGRQGREVAFALSFRFTGSD